MRQQLMVTQVEQFGQILAVLSENSILMFYYKKHDLQQDYVTVATHGISKFG